MNGRACFAVLVALSACDDGRGITRPNDVVVGTEREILAENPVVLAIDDDDPALGELIAVQQAVQQIVDERLPPP